MVCWAFLHEVGRGSVVYCAFLDEVGKVCVVTDYFYNNFLYLACSCILCFIFVIHCHFLSKFYPFFNAIDSEMLEPITVDLIAIKRSWYK